MLPRFSAGPSRPALSLALAGAFASALAGCGGNAGPLAQGGGIPAASAARQQQAVAGIEPAKTYTFTTLDDDADLTFNQLLGINDKGVIAGYFGNGVTNPNKGYILTPPYTQADYVNTNFPGSMQTQVTAINNKQGYTAGFWVDASGNNFGWIMWNGVFTSYKDPKTGKGTVNQILGLNSLGNAVGFYTDATGVNHGFEVAQKTSKFTPIVPTGLTNVTAAGINDNGDITGFGTSGAGTTVGFIMVGKTFTQFSVPNSTSTTPLGINKSDEVVGFYTDSASAMHGFVLTTPLKKAKFLTLDDPNGVGTTTINGLNDKGDLVGFYVDGTGNTDGFLAQP